MILIAASILVLATACSALTGTPTPRPIYTPYPTYTPVPEIPLELNSNRPTPHAEGGGQPPVSGDICQRSPAVQNALIEKLQLPSCQIINERELLRVTALKISSGRELWAGDLDGLYNLEGLSLSMPALPPPGILTDLHNLKGLKLSMPAPPPPGMLADLGNLSRIEMSFHAGKSHGG